MKKKHLLVGPLPPGWGGARVSFKMFYDYVQSRSKEEIEHCNLPVRSVCYKDALGKINHFKTVCIVLACLFRIPYVSNVIVFGSKNFCCSYGLLFLLVSKLFRKPFHVRFFGGHPAQNVIIQMPILGFVVSKFLALADKIIVEIYVGANEFPEHLKRKISVVVGYRPLLHPPSGEMKEKDDVFRFVYAGAITKEKGIANLLDAFESLREKAKGWKNIKLDLLYIPTKATLVQ